MKKIILTPIILLISILAFGQSGTKDGRLSTSDLSQLLMRIDAGMEIKINGESSSNEMTYVYTFEGNEEAYKHYFENFSPIIESRGGEGRFIVEFPKQTGKRVNHQIKKHSLVFNIPSNLLIELATRYSQIDIKNFERGLSIHNRSGLVKIENAKQNIFVNNEYGAVDVSKISGELTISNRSARIDLKDVTGRVKINAEYSKMNLSKIDGDLDISNRSGVVNAFDILGSLTADGQYVEYELTNIDGDVIIENKSSKVIVNTARSLRITGDYTHVTASNITSEDGVAIDGRSANISLNTIRGNTTIIGQYLNIDLKKIFGFTSIYNRSAKITIDDLQNDLTIEGEYLPIKVKNFAGTNVNVINRSGSISLDALKALNNILIDSQYGKIELLMKEKFSGSVSINLRYGKLDSNLELATQSVSTSNTEKRISGQLGNGTGKMIIKNSNSDTIIRHQ